MTQKPRTRYTPGPWAFGGRSKDAQTVVYATDQYSLAESMIANCNNGHHSAVECCANARLIAAAPDLLDILRDILPGLTDVSLVERARDVLKRAAEA